MSDLLGVTWLTLKALVPGHLQPKPLTRTDPELHPDLIARLTAAPQPATTAKVRRRSPAGFDVSGSAELADASAERLTPQ
ncbi:MAG: hypothetical protein AB1801_25985, partial [Chloroflexota bacterium]